MMRILITGAAGMLGTVARRIFAAQGHAVIPTLEALAPPPRVLPEHLAPYALADIGRRVYEMTVPEYRAVRHYIDRRWQLPPQVQQTSAMRLAVPLMQRLGIVPPQVSFPSTTPTSWNTWPSRLSSTGA